MNPKIKILVCLALIVGVTKSIGDDVVAEQRKNELAAALQALQEPQQRDSHIARPGWYKPEVRQKLRDLIEKCPDTEEAITAELWLATAELEVGQTILDRPKRRAGMMTVASAYERVIQAAPHSWQAKAARTGRTGTLLGAQRWEEARDQAIQILADIASYTHESNNGYLDFWETHHAAVTDTEPEIRFMLLVATTCQGKMAQAIALAEEMQVKFPEWSEKNLPGVVELLKNGKNPFGGF